MDDIHKKDCVNILRCGWKLAWLNCSAMALYTVVIWAFSIALLIPLVTWILRALGSNGDVIVGNYSIHLWLLKPQGIVYLLLAGSLVLFTVIMQGAGLVLIADTPQGITLSAVQALRKIVANLAGLLRLSLHIFLITLPFVALLSIVPGISYLLLLTEHDINFYLTNNPYEWTLMILISVVWICLVACGLVFLLIRGMFALPLWLENIRPLQKALRKSWRITRGRFRWLLRVMLICVLCSVFAAFVVHIILFSITGFILEYWATSIVAIVRTISGYLLLNTFIVSIIAFLGLAWGVSVWVICYRHVCERPDSEDDHAPILNNATGSVSVLSISLVRHALVVLLVLIMGSWGLSAWFMHGDVPVTVPIIIAHRAGAADAPENTLAALKRVIKDDVADMVEIDVAMTLDGELVIAHDKDLMRQGNDPRIIAETTYDDLRKVDIGRVFGPEFEGEHLERLENFLEMARDEIPMIVEFKHGKNTNLAEKTVQLIKKLEMEEEIILMSLELCEVRRVQELAPDIKVGYFASIEVGDLRKLDVDILGAKDGMCKPDFVRDIQEQGCKVYSWTIDEPARVMELIEIGVDGIITNDPKVVADVIRRFKKLTPQERILLRFRDFWHVLKRK